MVIFIGQVFSQYQVRETNNAILKQCENKTTKIVVILLTDEKGNKPEIPAAVSMVRQLPQLDLEKGADYDKLIQCAQKLVTILGAPWCSWDDLPSNPHLFSYEKDIVKFFRDLKQPIDPNEVTVLKQVVDLDAAREDVRRRILEGCPLKWPDLRCWVGTTPNRLDQEKLGKWRSDMDRVDVAASSRLRVKGRSDEVSFLEAGPRELLRFPNAGPAELKIGILVSGGIAPGINAVIDGIVQRHYDYAEANFHLDSLNVWGIQNGFLGTEYFHASARRLVRRRSEIKHQTDIVTCEHAHEGGSIIGTSRVDGLLGGPDRKARFERLAMKISPWADILYVIGGDGTMKAAHALWTVANDGGQKQQLSVVAVPKTMDNDILWMWQSFGFLSAVEKAREVIEQLSTEVESNPRLCVVQLFGSDSGFVVSHAVLASATGHCMAALIPEADFSMTRLAEHVATQITETRRRVPYALIVMAETAIPLDAEAYVDAPYVGLTDEERKSVREFCQARTARGRIQGQTPDSLRTAALKIVSRVLKELLPQAPVASQKAKPDWSLLRLVTNEPRHILRSTPPSTSDIITGHRLGTSAVDAAMAGYTDAMISQWLTEYVIVPLKLVVMGRKRIPEEGIFWKSVLAKTGQPADLTGQRAAAAHP